MWEANPDVTMGEVDLKTFIGICDAAEGLAEEYSAKTIVLKGIRARRDHKTREVSSLITRFRSAMRGYYGPDSIQYEQSGAVRKSARKRPRRKTKVSK